MMHDDTPIEKIVPLPSSRVLSALQVITSAQGEKWVVVVGEGGEMVKVKKRYAVWNDTVRARAN